MTVPDSPLFAPLAIGPLRVQGRVFKAATSETRATPDGHVTDELLAFYEPIFRAGTPLVITGNSYPSPQGKSTPLQAGCDADDKIPGLRRWATSRTGTAARSSRRSTTPAARSSPRASDSPAPCRPRTSRTR